MPDALIWLRKSLHLEFIWSENSCGNSKHQIEIIQQMIRQLTVLYPIRHPHFVAIHRGMPLEKGYRTFIPFVDSTSESKSGTR